MLSAQFYFTMSSLSLDLLALDTTPCINGYFSYAIHMESRLRGEIPAKIEHKGGQIDPIVISQTEDHRRREK